MMQFEQFFLGCLAHASYLIASNGEACIVDPQRDVQLYIDHCKKIDCKIKYVIETHLHADFISGHQEIARATGAQIVFSHKAKAAFEHLAVSDGDALKVGTVELKILETPGHTPESICVLITDTENTDKPSKVLTGDTLFVGDVGRPDLVGADGYTPEQMAGMLFDSLHDKLLKLDDSVEVYPAHGAGSLCGRNMSSERSSTIGQQRLFNCALKPMARDEFIKMATCDLPEAPAYFPKAVHINRSGPRSMHELPDPVALSAAQVNKLLQQGHTLLDVRTEAEFGAASIPGSINIGLTGQLASWAGTLIDHHAEIVIVAATQECVNEAVVRLARAGLENVKGYLEGGIESWRHAKLPLQQIPQTTVEELKARLDKGEDLQIIDVRRPGEYDSGHVECARSIPLSKLKFYLNDIDPSRPTAIICRSGYRSSTATSLLSSLGFSELQNIAGGTLAWVQAGFSVAQADTRASLP